METQTQTQEKNENMLAKEYDRFKMFIKKKARIDQLMSVVELVAKKYGIDSNAEFDGRKAILWDSKILDDEVENVLLYLVNNENITSVSALAEVIITAPRIQINDVECAEEINNLCTILREYGKIHSVEFDEDGNYYVVEMIRTIEEGELEGIEYGVYFRVAISLYLPNENDC